jgi:hypothetical protein
LRRTWDAGLKVNKCIGFDATEDHRVKTGGTYAVGNFAICPDPELPAYRDRYNVLYPLRERGYNRARCIEIIRAAGLPVPPKSACFFCPAMKQIEIIRLARVDPDLYRLAIAMEEIYRGGQHFRGDNFWTVKAKRKDTKEVVVFECLAESAVEARTVFRVNHDDQVKPYRYVLDAYRAVPGLGRDSAWRDLEIVS